MTELLTAAQMRAIEQAAIASGEVTGLELMERAGRGVVEAIFEEWPEFAKAPHRAVVLCGPGNNGGDGFVVARLLKEQAWEVEVFLYGDPEKLPPDARMNYERWGEMGAVGGIEDAISKMFKSAPAIVVDGIFGTGLSRKPDRVVKRLFREIHTCRWGSGIEAKIVSIDMPSGVCSDSGKCVGADDSVDTEPSDGTIFALEDCVEADSTVTFHRRKVGHSLAFGPFCSGKLVIVSLGPPLSTGNNLKRWLHESAGVPRRPAQMDRITVRCREPNGICDIPKLADNHKYNHGHALILSGGPGKTGAARLAARGALRIGAGLVTIGCPRTALYEIAAQTTAIMCRCIDGAPGLTEFLGDDRLNALCLGPGLGLGPDTQLMVLAALGKGGMTPRPTVLDADALTRFERNPDVLFDALHENCALTPHAGEFKRLFPDIAEKLDAPATTGPAYSKVDATREAAKRAGCTILFKGPDTVIADQSGRCAINSSAYERAAPWLATAGSGDVLAGYITGLLARGFGPMQAAETAAWLHTECALSFGPGLIAEDLPEELPKVFREIGL